jgi:hypothetical protein
MARRWLQSADVEVSANGALSVYGLIPTSEQDLAPITLNDDADHPLNLPAGAVILVLRADGDLVEGQAAPSQANNIVRDNGIVHSIPVAGRTVWHLVRAAGAGNVTVKGKILVAG